MSMDFDSQLIESVEVRRQRLTASLLFGENPTERRWKDRSRLLAWSVVLAAIICALLVAISFVIQVLTNWIAERDERERQQEEQRQEQERLKQEQEELRRQQSESASPQSAPSPGFLPAWPSATPSSLGPAALTALQTSPVLTDDDGAPCTLTTDVRTCSGASGASSLERS